LASAIECAFPGLFANIDIKESNDVGTFDVFINKFLVYSKQKTGRLPHPGEVENLITKRIGLND